MVELTKQFTKQPRRKKEPARRVPISAEERQAYEEQIRQQAERHAASLLAPDRDRR